MADRDPNAPEDNTRVETERIYTMDGRSGNASMWWIAGALVLAALIVGFIVLSGGEPAPVEPTTEVTTPAPDPEPAPAGTEDAVDEEVEVETAPAPEAEPEVVEPEPEPEAEPELEAEAEPAQ